MSSRDEEYLAGLDILYVEDDTAVRDQTGPFLRRRCRSLILAANGEEGLARFLVQRPHLVVTDLLMPMMDGLEMAEAIRLVDPTVPVIAVTAFDRPEYLLRSIEVGIDRYVLKPVQADRLHQALLHCAGNLRQQEQLRRNEAQILALNEQLERRVRERTAQLEAANQELAAISYSISHDLRAPLRAIDGFSHILLEGYGSLLDAEGRRYLERVRLGTQRMGHLIDGLLKVFRVSRRDLKRQPLDLSALARAVLDELGRRDPGRTVATVVRAGLAAAGDAQLVGLVLENLLENAWKFTAAAPAARIEFGAGAEAGEPVFFVRDNGTGFDMAYAAKLFGAFQRLHEPQEAPEAQGAGIGLAIAARIVQRHGGRIWATAEPGAGATFCFTLPDSPAPGPDSLG